MNNEIINRLERIETKLDNVIKSLHDYDEGTLHCEYSGLPSVEAYSDEEYGESSFEAFMDSEAELNKRMDIIGQKGNEGLHYDVEGDNDNTQDKHTVGDKDERRMVVEKKRNNERESGLKVMNEGQPKQKQYYKNKRSKRNENKK